MRGRPWESSCWGNTLRARRATRKRSRLGRSEPLVIDLARNAGNGLVGSNTGVVSVHFIRQFEIRGQRGDRLESA